MQWYSLVWLDVVWLLVVLVRVILLDLHRFPSLTAGSEGLGGFLSLFSASFLRSS